MSEVTAVLPPRQSVFDRIRGATFLLVMGIGAFALYYSLFFERKTSYLSNRNARLIAHLGDDIRRSIGTTGTIVANAATLSQEEIEALYEHKRGPADNQPTQAIFDSIKLTKAAEVPSDHQFAEWRGRGLRITFERKAAGAAAPQDQYHLDPRREQKPVQSKNGVRATVQLRRLIEPNVRQTATDVFDTVFILDKAGNVIYQWTRKTDDDSDAELKIIRLTELQVPRLFKDEVTLKASELMTTSRQMAVRIGDRKYQLFSIPFPSNVQVKNETQGVDPKAEQTPDQQALLGIPPDTWVLCGAVLNADFRSQSLAISTTLLCSLGAVILLVILSWPFLKMALSSAQQKVTLVDVILLGLSGVLGMAVVCLIVLDAFTYGRLQRIADQQLEELSREVEENLGKEIFTALATLDTVQLWAERQLTAGPAPIPARNANLLSARTPFTDGATPWFQSFALIDEKGRQRVKWSVDNYATPLVSVASRSYFVGPRYLGREYLTFAGQRISIESVVSITSGLPEVVFSRRTDAIKGDANVAARLPVIAMGMPAAPSLIDPVVPEGFGFAIVDESGKVLFHSDSARNTVENLFAETGDDPQVRSAVTTRQDKTMSIRYLGEDYAAHIRPMTELPWTIVTFREKRWLRTLNTEALLITLTFVLALALALIVFIAFLLLLRPRYRADWLWPHPKHSGAYAELSAAYFFLLGVAAVLLATLDQAALLLFPFCFIPLVLVVTYLYLHPKLRGIKWACFSAVAVVCVTLLIVQMWSTDGAVMPMVAASSLLALAGIRATWRPLDPDSAERAHARRTALPLCYVCAAFLLLLLMSIVPTAAFFRAAYDMELDSYVKRVQMKLAGDLQRRWWRINAEFDEERGAGKVKYRNPRWNETQDIYGKSVFGTEVTFPRVLPAQKSRTSRPVFPAVIEPILPVDSDASANTRELVRDDAADQSWWWTRAGSRLTLEMKNRPSESPVAVSSNVPQLLPPAHSSGGDEPALWQSPSLALAVPLLAISWIAFCIARFIARRVFLVDLVSPLALSRGYIGLRHVICHPCDDDSALRLFRDFKRIDLTTAEGLELARTAPQSFQEREMAVFIDGVDYSCATGERSAILRALIDRLTRNTDRTVVIRPTALTVMTRAILQGADRVAWSEALAPFVWVNWSQLVTTARTLSLSGATGAFEDDVPPETKRGSWRGLSTFAGFSSYFERLTDTRRAIRRMLKAETDGDPYLRTLVAGLGADATACDQVLDEIGERAEEYYSALWLTCNAHEQLVMMQLAQTGLVNNKARKHVRRLLARGHLRRDPQLRVMNESFRRFVLAQCTTSNLAAELEHNIAGDAWSRFRVPLFAGVAVVLLFFFMTQRQMFDSSIALVTGLAASLPAFVKMVSGLGNRAST
ncbi:MAG TPA: cache domain-containing protein [Thermoanaerobaculia bacterium]|nr:cache domain-containing protein [Thermoanaerobaculia bacterium]